MVVTELPTAPLLLLCKNNKTKTGQSDSSAHLSPLHPPAGIKITKTYSYPITISAHAGFFFWHISWKKYSVWVEFSEEISAAVINRYEIREAAKHWEFSNARRHLDYCVCVCVWETRPTCCWQWSWQPERCQALVSSGWWESPRCRCCGSSSAGGKLSAGRP